VFLPLANADFLMNWDVSITAIQRFVFVLVLMLPFEIRDLQYDSVKLATIPQQIGVKKTKLIGVLLLMVFFFLDYLKDDIQLMNLLVLLVVTAITLLSVVLAKKEQSKYYSAFFVEGIPVLWLLLVLVFQLLT
jgi:predicted cation transporter